jgi:hypothetical protein
MVVYRGHGSSTSIDVPYSVSSFHFIPPPNGNASISNNHLKYLPFGFGWTCLTNNYAYNQHTFGEGFTTASKNGGVTYFGSTTISYTDKNRYSSRRVLKKLKDKKNRSIAQMTVAGMTDYYNACRTSARRKQVEKYNLLGDPSLMLYGIVEATGNPANYAPKKDFDNNQNSGGIKVYPTLADNFIQIEAPSDINISSIALYDLIGRKIKAFDNNLVTLDISNVANGAYILTIISDKDQISSFKIVINH